MEIMDIMIKIISDSTCDLSRDLLEKYNISLLPLHVILGEEEYLDGVNIDVEYLYTWSNENKTTPKTAAPSQAEAMELFKPIIDAGDEIIAFSISSSMSASYNCMRLAAEALDATDKVSVIDSASLTTGVGILAIEASIMASNGSSREEIVEYIKGLIPHVRASFMVDTLTFLHRGGRCSGVAALAGNVLKLHPRIYVEDGAMKVGKKYRGKYDLIVPNYVTDMEESILNAKTDRLFITHSGINENIIKNVTEYLESLGIFEEIIVTRAGSVISSHCGPGTLGVIFIEK